MLTGAVTGLILWSVLTIALLFTVGNNPYYTIASDRLLLLLIAVTAIGGGIGYVLQ